MKIKAILFDLVGTLIYVKDSVGTVYSNVANGFGYNCDPNKLDKAFTLIFKSAPPSCGGNIKEKDWWKNIVFQVFKSSNYDLGSNFDQVFEEIFKEFSKKSSWAVYPEVVSTLKICKEKSLKVGLISNFDSRLEVVLKEVELINYFDSIVYSGKVKFCKPDPRIFQYALDELNVISEEVLYIGDSLDIDYYPAKEVNINPLLIDRDNRVNINDVKTISNLHQIFDFLVS